jgi:hypothetical protein
LSLPGTCPLEGDVVLLKLVLHHGEGGLLRHCGLHLSQGGACLLPIASTSSLSRSTTFT